MRFLILSLLGCSLSYVLTAQDTLSYPASALESKGKNICISEPSMILQMMPLIEGVGSNTRDALKEQSLKSYMMPPRKLGIRSNSLAYAMASCMEYYLNLKSNFKDNLSPDYISLNTVKDGKQGALDEQMAFLSVNGTVSAAIVPYDAQTISPAVYATGKYKITNYLYIFHNTAKAQEKQFQTRQALLRGNPVIIDTQVTQAFLQLQNARYWYPDGEDKTIVGNQFLVVVGYDDERKAFEALNCMGSEWGNRGYIWINYEDFGKYVQNGYVLVVAK